MLVKLTPGEWHLVKKQTFNFTKTANVQFSCKQTCSGYYNLTKFALQKEYITYFPRYSH